MRRKTFLKNTALVSLAVTNPFQLLSKGLHRTTDRYADIKSKKYLSKVKVESKIEDEKIFTEGPAADGNGNIYFTNVPAQKILKWNPRHKKLSVFMTDSMSANGLRFTPQGDLLACEGAGHIVKINPKTRERQILCDSFDGKSLQSPNDLDFDSQGRIYFSSRNNNADLSRQNVKAVYRLDPDGTVHQLLKEPEIHMPNGIVISPDEKTLYLIEAHPAENHNRKILAFDLSSEGTLSNMRTLVDFYPGRSGDGMCIDMEGNLYVAAGLHKTRDTSETLDTKPGIHVISPDGKLLAFRQTPQDTITNCTFGGKNKRTLYVTCGSLLLSIKTKIRGY